MAPLCEILLAFAHESQELARYPAIEQVDALGNGEADLPCQRAIAGEHAQPPAGAAFAKYPAQSSIQRFQVLLLPESLAIGRVADQRARGTGRRFKFSHIGALER